MNLPFISGRFQPRNQGHLPKGQLGQVRHQRAVTFAQAWPRPDDRGRTAFPTFLRQQHNWQTTNITFTAAQSNLVCKSPDWNRACCWTIWLWSNFAATNITYLTNITYVTNTIYAANGFEGAAAGITSGPVF